MQEFDVVGIRLTDEMVFQDRHKYANQAEVLYLTFAYVKKLILLYCDQLSDAVRF